MKEKIEFLAEECFKYAPLNNNLFPPSIYYRFLMLLAKEFKPSLSVELGVCGGGGSLHMAIGNPYGHTVGIDIAAIPEPQYATMKAMVNNFVFWQGDSVGSAKEVTDIYGKCGLLFIDTTHTIEQTIKEFEGWKPYLSDKAIVCFDDLLRPDMRGFWQWLPEPKLRIDKLHSGAENGGGFGIWWQE